MTIVVATDLALKLLVFGWFGYARRHFATTGKEPMGMVAVKLTYIVGLFNLWLLLFLHQQDSTWSILGLAATIFSAVIFYYSMRASKAAGLHVAFSELTGAALVSGGIYGVVRHPFYLGYVIYWFSWCLSSAFALLSLAVLLVLIGLYLATIRLEEKQLEQNFGEEYRNYRNRTSCLVPYVF